MSPCTLEIGAIFAMTLGRFEFRIALWSAMRSALFAFLMILIPGFAPGSERPNILWIIADDLSPDLGCYGYEHVATPHLDQLAAEGMRFDAAFSSAPVCSSSRSAFITGMYQTSIGSYHHRTEHVVPLPEGIQPVTEHFREAGYFVCNGQDPEGERRGKSDYNFEYDAKTIFDGTGWQQRAEGQPFFAQIQIKEPHRAFVIAPVTEERHLSAKLPPYYLDHPLALRDWQAYLQTIEVLDDKVGRALARLESDGLADNTVVIFFGDHGRPHIRGKQFLYEGGIRVPLIVRWPGKIDPGTVSRELVNLIDLAPTCLAMCGIPVPESMQGVTFWPQQSPQRKFLFAARDRCGDANDRIRCVRTQRFKYLRNFLPEVPYTVQSSYKEMGYPMLPLMRYFHDRGRLNSVQDAFFAEARPEEELYDLESDPWETVNLAGQPEHAATLATLRGELERWMKETGDQGGTPEFDPTLEEIIEKTRPMTYERPIKKRGLPNPPSDRHLIDWWKKNYDG
jgi:uncharacterized sulfatase